MYEFHDANSQIQFPLDYYPNSCITPRNDGEPGNTLDNFSPCFPKHIPSEPKRNTACEMTVGRVGTGLRRTRNHRSEIVSINSLPAELLTRIFDLVHLSETCLIEDSGSTETLTSNPSPYESISHVCSYWRSITLGSSRSWSHIDLAPYHRLGPQLAARALAFIDRAGSIPLSVHVSTASSSSGVFDETELSELYSRIANRAQSLALQSHSQSLEGLAIILDRFLSNGIPGALNKLTIRGKESRNIRSFIVSADSDWGHSGLTPWKLNLPHSRFENILRGVTDLRLTDIYFPWESQAYHGLTNLSLTGSVELPITVPQVANILGSSPRIRSLHFGIYIQAPLDAAFPPITLDDLEILQLESRNPKQQLALLQLLAPGTRALRVSIPVLSLDVSFLSSADFRNFVNRCKLAHLRLRGSHSALPLPELLTHVPNLLDSLELEGYSLLGNSNCSSIPKEYNSFPNTSQLGLLSLRSCTVDLNDLRRMHELNLVRQIIAQEDTCILEPDDRMIGSLVYGTRRFGNNAVDSGPVVELVKSNCMNLFVEDRWY